MTLSPKTTQKICTQRAERRQPKRLKNWCSSSRQVCAADKFVQPLSSGAGFPDSYSLGRAQTPQRLGSSSATEPHSQGKALLQTSKGKAPLQTCPVWGCLLRGRSEEPK